MRKFDLCSLSYSLYHTMSRQPPRYIKLREFLSDIALLCMARGFQTVLHAEDFPAHNGNVNCIKIGQKSSGVLVTGGDDKKVNLWTIGAQTKALVRPASCGTRMALL